MDLEDLRSAAREMELSPFRSHLRAQAAKRIRALRETPNKDPFEWDGAALASVPAFAENRSLVEALYHSLRGEEELGGLFDF